MNIPMSTNPDNLRDRLINGMAFIEQNLAEQIKVAAFIQKDLNNSEGQLTEEEQQLLTKTFKNLTDIRDELFIEKLIEAIGKNLDEQTD